MNNQIKIGILAPLMAFGSCTSKNNPSKEPVPNRPNVLFIAVDDLNDWLGCMKGHPQAITPNFDRLAVDGVLFTNAHCASPICQPSRASIMTGLYPSTTGMHYFIPRNIREEPTLKDRVMLTEHFARNGYYTLGVGKITHKSIPELYDEFGGHGSAGPRRDENEKLSYPLGHPLWDWGAFPAHDSILPDFKDAKWAIEQLKRDFEKPFFLALGFHRPHVPLYVPQKWFDMYPLENIQLPEVNENDLDDISAYALDLTYGSHAPRHQWMVENKQWKHAVQSYLACITFVDHYLGEVLDALEKSKYADNTVIVLWSDHGFHLGEKLRWEKRSLWEESTKVPLIFAGPGIAKNRVCDSPVGLIDLFPTLNEICNLPAIADLEGASIMPLLKDPGADWERPAITSLGPDSYSVRTVKWRFIIYGDGSMELYDRENDPGEWKNLAYDNSRNQIISELKKYIPVYSKPMPDDSFDSGTFSLYN